MTIVSGKNRGAVKLLRKRMPHVWALVKQQGWSIEPTKGGHIRLTAPDGRRIICPSSSSDYRAERAVLTRMRNQTGAYG